MKVMCINDNWKVACPFPYKPPVFGNTYTVSDTHFWGRLVYYSLAEYPHPNPTEFYGFCISHFAPLQDDPQPEEQIEEPQTATA